MIAFAVVVSDGMDDRTVQMDADTPEQAVDIVLARAAERFEDAYLVRVEAIGNPDGAASWQPDTAGTLEPVPIAVSDEASADVAPSDEAN